MDFREKQIAAPKSWVTFEDLCLALFRAVWKDPHAQKNGRIGQPQNGVDIIGRPGWNLKSHWGIQCKGKDQSFGSKASLEEVKLELAKAENFSPRLSHWVFATTSPSDSTLQRTCREISQERQLHGQFSISLLSWDDIQSLLAENPAVLQIFYPEHAFDLPAILSRLAGLPTADEFRQLIGSYRSNRELQFPHGADHLHENKGVWVPVTFENSRDLGPAIMGRPLGPADAAACPRLAEADSVITQLRSAYSVRLVGEAGTGKSVCAYQVALEMKKDGWKVFRLSDSKTETLDLVSGDRAARTLFLIDDAHLMPDSLLRAAEEKTTARTVLLSTHTMFEHAAAFRGAISINPKRAINTIASALRANLAEALRVVRMADDTVGERWGNEPIERRIAHAEEVANAPWQFCFILGGGWRRASWAADNARLAGADIVLAAAAINQIASRDAKACRSQILGCLRSASVETSSPDNAIDWLVSQHLLIGLNDLRCPHQRFASIVLKRILHGQDEHGRQAIAQILKWVVEDDYPLAGLRSLLHELRFGSDYGRWTGLLPAKSLSRLTSRCWAAASAEDRTNACFIATDLDAYIPNWVKSSLAGQVSLLANWVSDPVVPSGYGLGHLLNHIRNTEPNLLTTIVRASNPATVASAVSAMGVDDTYSLAEMLGGMANQRSRDWGAAFVNALDREKLFKLASSWPRSESLFGLAKFCQSLTWCDEKLALDLVECWLPVCSERFREDPIVTFQDLDPLLMSVLRVFDPLGVFVGRYRPDSRRLFLARRICSEIKAQSMAKQISSIAKRDFQTAAFVLHFMSKIVGSKFEAAVAAIDWEAVEQAIGDEWGNLPHDKEIFFGITFSAKNSRDEVTKVIERNAHRIELFPPRLALMARQAAFAHVQNGKKIRFEQYDHVDWTFGAVVTALFADERPDLLDVALSPWEPHIARALSQADPSWYAEAANFLSIYATASPTGLQRVLGQIHVATVESGWAACLRKGSGARRSIGLLIEAAKDRPDRIGLVARDLRRRFPTSSVPRGQAGSK